MLSNLSAETILDSDTEGQVSTRRDSVNLGQEEDDFQENNVVIVLDQDEEEDCDSPQTSRRRLNPQTGDDDQEEELENDPNSNQNLEKEDDETNSCPICFEPWTTAGSHRLVSLGCGHLYGKRCINKWINGNIVPGTKKSKCPQCNTPCTKRDIRILFAKKLSAVDNVEHEAIMSQLNDERARRCKLQQEHAQLELSHALLRKDLQKYQQEALKWKRSYDDLAKAGLQLSSTLCESPLKIVGQYQLSQSQLETFKVMALGEEAGLILVSKQRSKSSQFNETNDICKVSMNDLNCHEVIPAVHESFIRDIKFDKVGKEAILTTSWDKSLKITSIVRSNSVVASFKLPANGWSCTYASFSDSYVFAGLSNSLVVGYDTRNISTPMMKLTSQHFSSLFSTIHSTHSVGNYLIAASFDRIILFEFHSGIVSRSILIHSVQPPSQCVYASAYLDNSQTVNIYATIRAGTYLNYRAWEIIGDQVQEIFTVSLAGGLRNINRTMMGQQSGQQDSLLLTTDAAQRKLLIWDANNCTESKPMHELETFSSTPIMDICISSITEASKRNIFALSQDSLFHISLSDTN